MSVEVKCVWDLGAELGEGPVWSATQRVVWFVDIKHNRIHRYEPAHDAKRTWTTPAAPGFVVPLRGGGFIAGLKSGLHRFEPTTGSFTLLTAVEAVEIGNRLNDAHVDAQGRLWFGSMHDAEQAESGALYRLDLDGKPVRLDAGYCITNGPCVSPDGCTFYHTDTLQGVIYAFDLADDGSLGNKRVFIRIERSAGYPDGSSIDAEGCLWTGMWGGWSVRRYSPQGELIDAIRLPCANVTKAVFGGDDLKTLYITTAWKGLSPRERQQQPLAGGLFTARVETPGLPSYEVRLNRDP